jgi:hypothetical protein
VVLGFWWVLNCCSASLLKEWAVSMEFSVVFAMVVLVWRFWLWLWLLAGTVQSWRVFNASGFILPDLFSIAILVWLSDFYVCTCRGLGYRNSSIVEFFFHLLHSSLGC